MEENQAEMSGSNSYFSFVAIQFQSFPFFFSNICVSDKGSLNNFETVERRLCERDLISFIQIRLLLRN